MDATLTDVVGGTGSTSGQVRLQLRQGLTLLEETGDIGFPGDPATPTVTDTPDPTAVATNTAVPALPFGCQTLNLASFNGTYAGAGFNSFAFLAGKIVTAIAVTATGSAAVRFELNFTPDGEWWKALRLRSRGRSPTTCRRRSMRTSPGPRTLSTPSGQ